MNSELFREILFQQCNINPSQVVLAGISGGPDSLCMLDLLHQCGINVIAAHLDHSLRVNSETESERVAGFCEAYNIPLIRSKKDVSAYSRINQLTIEEGARILRYEFLFEEAEKNHAQAVLVAHHADDQVETVLMHILRGSGLSGLAGMKLVMLPNPWSEKIPLIRPLLNCWRDEILAYCDKHHLEPVLDESNQDNRYYRNRIRNDLISELRTYNPQVKFSIHNMSTLAAREDDYLDSEAERYWQNTIQQTANEFIVFNRAVISSFHPAIQGRILRKAIFTLNKNLRDVEFNCIERALQFIRKPSRTNQTELCGGLSIFNYLHKSIVVGYKIDMLSNLWPQVINSHENVIPVPGEIQLNDQWSLRTRLLNSKTSYNEPYQGQVDRACLTGDLLLSCFQPGDRFSPFGMNGKTMKLGDFWTNEGLPARARTHWPLIRSGDQIIWIPGFRIADSVRVTENTSEIIQIELIKKSSGS